MLQPSFLRSRRHSCSPKVAAAAAGEAEVGQAEPVAEVPLEVQPVLQAVPVGHLALLELQAPPRRERLLLP